MAYEVVKAIQVRQDKVLVTVKDTDQVLDVETGECRQVTVSYNPATGSAHLQQKIKNAFAALVKTVDTSLKTEITAAVESITTAEEA